MRVIQQGLGDAYALAHTTGVAAEWAAGGVCEIHELQQFGNASPGAGGIETSHGRPVFEKLQRAEVRIHTEVLRQVAEHGAQRVGRPGDVGSVPEDAAFGRSRYGAKPDVKFSLEMIVRDPLEVPCLTDKYWATFENRSGSYLARALSTAQLFFQHLDFQEGHLELPLELDHRRRIGRINSGRRGSQHG